MAALVVVAVLAVVMHRSDDDEPGSAGVVAPRPAATSTGPRATSPSAPAPEPADRCVADALDRMSPAQRAGQVVMVGAAAEHPEALAAAVRRSHLGGIFLAGRSTAASVTLGRRIAVVQAAAERDSGVGVHVAVDQEGGKVQTLGGADFTPIASALRQGRDDAATLRIRTTEWARALAAAGVTMDLAPVADTVPAGTAADNPPIGAVDRHYGSTPAAVAADVAVVVDALQRARVVATAKHFPGLGRVRVNTDRGVGAVDARTTVDDPHLAPFQAAIAAGAGAVMVSSATYPRLDPHAPAAFSRPIVTDLLKRRLGFAGVVVSDDLGAASAVQSVGVGERAVRFVRAGGDLVLTVRGTDAVPMTKALAAEARRSDRFARRLDDAAHRVLVSKQRLGLLDCAGSGTARA